MKDADEIMARIKKGAFLTVTSEGQINTMTIGWATIGIMWHKPVMMIAVRSSRHTFGIIEQAKDFTVSIPSTDMKKEIMFCGTKSGRDFNKFQECSLSTKDSRQVSTPIINLTGLHYECSIVYKTAMNPEYLDNKLEELYPEKDYHTLYFGKIIECYKILADSV
jgi:flavin reductase (DIM6/NTAB) family NADH-FMN oxidoreductase RutF